jgi:D-alanine--D-alanine ligase
MTMRITVAYNLRTESTEAEAELLREEDVDRIATALRELRHRVTAVEVSGPPDRMVERLLDSEPDLVFNVAEGTVGSSREAYYPGIYEQLGIPFTGGNASLLHLNLDKHLAKTVVASRGLRVPRGTLITTPEDQIPDDLEYPLFIKPNSEGSSKGITQDSVVETPEICRKRIATLLPSYPAGLVVEEFISGRELSVPFLEAFPGQVLEIVEHTFDLEKLGSKYNVYDYDMKQGGERVSAVNVVCPAPLSAEERGAVIELSRRVFREMCCPDFGRVDVRLREDGTPFFIELNPLPALHPGASLMTGARSRGLEFRDALRLVVRSAARRHGIPLRRPRVAVEVTGPDRPEVSRPTFRELGGRVGRLEPGVLNAITDVKGVKVGHVTRVEDGVKVPGVTASTAVRTGVTAVLPAPSEASSGGGWSRGVRAERRRRDGWAHADPREWGWHRNADPADELALGGPRASAAWSRRWWRRTRVSASRRRDAAAGWRSRRLVSQRRARRSQHRGRRPSGSSRPPASGPVEQGSVGAGPGMITFDFAGGIGSVVALAAGGSRAPSRWACSCSRTSAACTT